jgi:tricorn protease
MSDVAGTSQFISQYYPQQDKEGLVLDVRWNTGGFAAQLILERLRRTVAGVFLNRQHACTQLPDGTVGGPKVVLTNQYSASDGDQFPYFFRRDGLGKVVGNRTWGGVRGVLGAWSLMDGTTVNVPKDVLLTAAGDRIIENVGTRPDIEVDADATGTRDVQLEAAVGELLPTLRGAACDKPPVTSTLSKNVL